MNDTIASVACWNACRDVQKAQSELEGTRENGLRCLDWWHSWQHCPVRYFFCPEECKIIGQRRDRAMEILRQSCPGKPCGLRASLNSVCNWCNYNDNFLNLGSPRCF